MTKKELIEVLEQLRKEANDRRDALLGTPDEFGKGSYWGMGIAYDRAIAYLYYLKEGGKDEDSN